MWTLAVSLRLLAVTALAAGADVRILPEHLRPDPFGGVVPADGGEDIPSLTEIDAARGGYVSVHITVPVSEISVQSKLEVDVYREWFHRNKSDNKYYPDALVPYGAKFEQQIPGQKVRAFWLDIWVPATVSPGDFKVRVNTTELTVHVKPAIIPADDPVMVDHNSYGTSWMFSQYAKTLRRDDEAALFALIHAYHRIFYEHRGDFHQLGYGHGGKVGPEFAPELTGSGRNKHVRSWDRFDRHYGPLLDGSAFRSTRRGPRPIPYTYLPINPEWPASYLWWGEPGYEIELTNVVSEMEKHFRDKGWTKTYFELFFNHKKRYKAFSWDGDEVRFARDNDSVTAFRRMFDKAIPKDSPVRFVTRSDTSWSMEDQFDRLKGIVNFWVAGEGMLSWYPGAVEKLKARGDQVWSYGGTPAVDRPSSAITLNPLRSWITGVQGFVRWQTVDPGPDPWENFEGGGETLVYPGDRFGLAEPLPSIRLKLQRNMMQDLALIESKTKTIPRRQVQAEVVSRFNGTSLEEWRNSRPAMASTPVLEWNNISIDEALRPFEARFANISSGAWLKVREYARQ